MERNVRLIQQSRNKLIDGLSDLGFYVYPSQANFVMAQKRGQKQEKLYDSLKRRKIFVRYFDTPGLQDSLRITVGRDEEIDALLRAIATLQGTAA